MTDIKEALSALLWLPQLLNSTDLTPLAVMLEKDKDGRMFKPPPALPTPREDWNEDKVDKQLQSGFLTKLPAEIRNEIYMYVLDDKEDGQNLVFDVEEIEISVEGDEPSPRSSCDHVQKHPDSTSLKAPAIRTATPKPPHPLSLLLTCRLISTEATLLAFTLHPFVFSPTQAPTYTHLRNLTSHLSTPQRTSLTHLSYDLNKTPILTSTRCPELLANTILLFPSFKTLTLRIRRTKLVSTHNKRDVRITQCMIPAANGYNVSHLSFHEAALRRYVPTWFRDSAIVSGRSYAWPRGEKWNVVFPQLRSPLLNEDVDWDMQLARWVPGLFMSLEAVGTVPGVGTCVCGCGGIVWLANQLVQETGRKLDVRTVFYVDERRDLEDLWRDRPKVVLREGAEKLKDAVDVQGGQGVVFEPGGKYWEDIRARNGVVFPWMRNWKGAG